MASPSAGQLSALVAALRSEAVGQRVLSAQLEERGLKTKVDKMHNYNYALLLIKVTFH